MATLALCPSESPDYQQFYQLQRQSAREKEFFDLHVTDWLHGPGNIHTVILYTPTRLGRENGSASAMDEIIFSPQVVMEPITPKGPSTRLSSLALGLTDGFTSQHAKEFKKDHEASAFSGLYNIPRFSVGNATGAPLPDSMQQYCYQAHFEIGEVTYMFGGLRTDPAVSLKTLGIPRSTDLSRISVHLPGDLPPFVNKEVLMSPLLAPNPSFILFNPTRGTVQEYPRDSYSDEFPGHLLQAVGTQVSPHKVFWCGGIEAKVVSVTHDQDIDRWIVRKKIVPNKYGYLMDSRSLSFTKVDIRSKLYVRYSGSLGSTVVSNVLQEGHDLHPDLPLPVFAGLGSPSLQPIKTSDISVLKSKDAPKKDSPGSKSRDSPVSKSRDSPVPKPSDSPVSKLKESPLSKPSDSPASKLKESPLSKPKDCPTLKARDSFTLKAKEPSLSQKHSDTVESPAVSSATLAYSSKPQAVSEPVSRKTTFNTSSDAQHSGSPTSDTRTRPALHSHPSLSPSMHTKSSDITKVESNASLQSSVRTKIGETLGIVSSSPPLPASTSSLKVSSMLHKSTRLFHRDRSSSVKVGGTPVQSQSSYSSHVKSNRSVILQGPQTSRPTSPQIQKKPLNTRPLRNVSSLEHTESASDTSSASSTTSAFTLAIPAPRPSKTQRETSEKNVLATETASANFSLVENTVLKPDVASVTIYQFGGFKYTPDEDGRPAFTATNELLKIELLLTDKSFHSEALLLKISPGEGELWPSPRGYFASVLINANSSVEACHITSEGSSDDLDLARSPRLSAEISSVRSPSLVFHSLNGDSYFDRKCLLVHGGVNSDYETFSELYMFSFATGKWETMLTYAFDYYKLPKQPFEDEMTEELSVENQVKTPELVEAEFRSCHHRAHLYTQDDIEYVFFLGGFQNDYLRHVDKIPYTNDKFDVSRLSKFLFSSTNSNLLRIPVLNIKSQQWKFSRFFYDLSETVLPQAMETLMGNRYMKNSRTSFHGGAFSLVGKQITICHGMVEFVPEKKRDHGKIVDDLKATTVFLGGHTHLVFPNM